MGTFFRRGLVAAGLVAAIVAWFQWTGGMPPLWSMAAHRVQTVVTRTELTDATDMAGHTDKVAHIYVAWPPGSETGVEVPGLRSQHQRWHLHYAGEITRAHPVGSTITVRVVGGWPVADRIDLHDLAYALLATIFAILLIGWGVVLSVNHSRDRGEEEPVT